MIMPSLFNLLLWFCFCFCFGIKPFHWEASRESRRARRTMRSNVLLPAGISPASQDPEKAPVFLILDNKQHLCPPVCPTLNAETSLALPPPSLAHLPNQGRCPFFPEIFFHSILTAPRTVQFFTISILDICNNLLTHFFTSTPHPYLCLLCL